LVIPEKPTDLSFLQGCWYSDSHLSGINGNPVKDKYCFDAQGQGSLHPEEMNDSGGVMFVCRATATAQFVGKQLVFIDSGAKCPRGDDYPPYRVVCTSGESGRASCKGSTSSGQTYNVDVKRVN
jgi:hypothetical protein